MNNDQTPDDKAETSQKSPSDFFAGPDILKSSRNGITVKTLTKKCDEEPTVPFDVSVPISELAQVNVYVFTAVKNDLSGGWLLGWIKKKDLENPQNLKSGKYVLTSDQIEPAETLNKYLVSQ